MNPSLTAAQLAVLLVLSEGRARVSNRTVAGEHRVSSAVWTFAYGSLRSQGLVVTWREGDDWLADITPDGRALVAELAKVAR